MSDFERVKAAINLKTLIPQVTGKKMGKHHLEECPFCHGHDCFSIKDDGWKCFQCVDGDGSGGDVFNFFGALHSLDTVGALRMAAEYAGIELEDGKRVRVKLSEKDRVFLDAAEYYHERMLSNGGKKYFVETRGHDQTVLEKMKIGMADGNLVAYLKARGFSEETIVKSGLVNTRSIEDRLQIFDFFGKGMAIFPHFHKGKILHFTSKDPEKKRKPYQLKKQHRSSFWMFYNQEAIEKYSELIMIEGEDDLLSVLDAKVNYVFGIIGQIADEQIEALKKRSQKKHLYLWMDNDQAGRNYTRKICGQAVGINTRIIIYDGEDNDPDDYLRGFQGDKRKEIKRLQAEAVDYITWEIMQAAKLPDLEKKLLSLKDYDVFQAIARGKEVEKEIYIEKLVALGFSSKAIEQQLGTSIEIRTELNLYLETLYNPKEADPNVVAGIVHRYFSREGRFFYDPTDTVYLLYRDRTYEVSANHRPFCALMKKLTMLLPNKAPGGASTWESLASEAYNTGKLINFASWIDTDRATDSVYINLNAPNNIILKINKDGIYEIPNGLNDDHVLLKSSKKIQPFNYLPDADIKEGFHVLKELIFDNLTCSRENRYFILCWMITGFLLDFVSYQALNKFSGASASGKSTAAKLVSLLLYGSEHLGDPTAAAAFAMASQNPLVIIDNLESSDITKNITKFLLLAATRGQKEKRTSGSDTDVMEESLRALVLITAIEPFTLAELINRTVDIGFHHKYRTDAFIEDEVTRAVIKNRDLILSSIIKLIQKEILPNLAKRRDYIAILQKEYRGHAKDRLNEYLALMMLILEKIEPHIPFYDENSPMYGAQGGDAAIWRGWIEYQNSRAKDTEVSSNTILKLLDGIVREYMMMMKDKQIEAEHVHGFTEDVFVFTHPEYGIEIIKTKPEIIPADDDDECCFQSIIEFTATSKDLVFAFDKFCRNNGLKNPYLSASVFGSRLGNDRRLLKKGGWEQIITEKHEPYYKVVKGQRFYKFRHTLIR